MEQYQVTTDWLAVRAADTPEADALLADGRWWRFGELDVLASRLCARLAADGARPGEHVAVLLPNSLAFAVSVFALARLGAVMVPLNTRLTPAEVAWQVARADCTRLICAPPTTAQAADVPATLPRLIVPLDGPAFKAWAFAATNDQRLTTNDQPAPRHLPLATHQAIIFTSGTTGYAKGALITFANHFWSAVGSAFRLGVVPGDRWLACLPLYHVGGLAVLFRSCLYGTAVVLHDGFNTAAVRHSLRHDGVTLVSLVPTMLSRLLHEGLTIDDAPTLRLVLLGGAAAPAALLAEARAAGLPVAVTYGLTEAASQVATMLPSNVANKPGSAGKPLFFTTVAAVDDDGCDLPPGQPGEIVVRGPTVMAGYYRDAAATSAALRDGRLHTGDVGYLDEDGDLWLLDRRADLIVSGGENIYPAQVERVLREHPAVALAAVVGLPHADWGQQVAAAVVLRSPGAATSDELLAHCRAHLAGYKRPRRLLLCDALPQTASGKIQRRLVAEQLVARDSYPVPPVPPVPPPTLSHELIAGLRYTIEESGKGQPLVLLHGFTGRAANWRPLLPRLAGRWRVIAIDLPGHGDSGAPAEVERYTMPRVAADLVELLGRRAAAPAHWLGYSMGGRLALYVAVEYPGAVRSLLLESATAGLRDAAERQARRTADEALAARIERDGMADFVTYWEQLPLFSGLARLPEEERAFLHNQRLGNNPLGLANSLRGMGTGVMPPLWSRLPSVVAPTLLIAGELDAKFVALNQGLTFSIPDATLRLIPNAGHTVHLEQPTAYLAAVTDFLDRLRENER